MKRTKRWKAGKGKMPKLNKRFMYAVAGIGLFLAGFAVHHLVTRH